MENRYRHVRRQFGVFYSIDKETGRKVSLNTKHRQAADRLIAAKNEATEQPALNKGLAKVYLSAASPDFATRTWADVMAQYVSSGVESTKDRKQRAFRSRPFAVLHQMKLIDTSAEHLFAVLEHKKAGNSTNHYLRCLHNFALHLGWLLAPVMAEAAWPAVRSKKAFAITSQEHHRIVARENNVERRLYYEFLWETGGAQSDIANLDWDRIDRQSQAIHFQRQKLEGRGAGITCLRIGQRIQNLLLQVPREGPFFPKIRGEDPKHRAAEFRRRCRTLKIEGRTLHSYRYGWAQRARTAGMPERDAMNHLGHKSKAVHSAYATAAMVTILPLEFYEAERANNVIKFEQSKPTVQPASTAATGL